MLKMSVMETAARTPLGKQVKGNRYFHVVALEELEPHLREQVQYAVARYGLSIETEFNVIKIDEAGNQISLLDYEDFFDKLFPALKRSYVVNLVSGPTKCLSYDSANNPPILWRTAGYHYWVFFTWPPLGCIAH